MSALLRQFIGDPTLPDADGIDRHAWTRDKYTMGAYSNPRVKATGKDYKTLAKPYFTDESKKSGILFAGEACSPDYWSFMHGARFSGLKAAQDIADALKDA